MCLGGVGNAGQAGGTNQGGGGGSGGGDSTPPFGGGGGTGGTGLVVVRMPTVNYELLGEVTGSPTTTTQGSDTILQFTGSGSITA